MKKLKKLLGILAFTFIFNSVNVEAAWMKDDKGWWNTEGNSWSVGWRFIDGKWYHFNEKGYMETGWFREKGKWYYLNTNGDMITEDFFDGYYFNKDGVGSEDAIIFYTEKPSYEIGTKIIRVCIVDNMFKSIEFDEEFEIEKFEDNKWEKLGLNKYDIEEMAWLIEPYSCSHKNINLKILNDFEKLTRGKYRVLKDINGEIKTAEFELK